jgi:hypothetical protein
VRRRILFLFGQSEHLTNHFIKCPLVRRIFASPTLYNTVFFFFEGKKGFAK